MPPAESAAVLEERRRRVARVRAGAVPPLAEAFAARGDSAPRAGEVLVPGAAVALVPGSGQAGGAGGWAGTCGKTQVAAWLAESAWRSGGVEVLAWVAAESRASVLSGYAEAAARLGLGQPGDGEAAAARFAAWLGSTPRPWLVVLDGLRDPADVQGLWPAGAAGRLIVTTAQPENAGSGALVLPVGFLAPREAVSYLSDRLSGDPDHRAGQMDLALELGGEPAALAHAAAVIETSELSCRDYQEIFQRHRAALEQSGAGAVAAAEVTWRLSARHAEILNKDAGTWPMLVLASLLGGHGIPLAVLTGPVACRYLAGDGPGSPGLGWSAIGTLGMAGLLGLDRGATPPVARVGGALRASVLATVLPELAAEAAGAAADALLEAWHRDQPSSPLAALLRSCATSLLDAAGDALWAGGSCHRVLLAAGRSLDAARVHGPAAAWWQQLTERSARVLGQPGGKHHPDTVVAAGLLADALVAAGQGGTAVEWAQWVLTARTGALGPDHRGTIAARAGLGRALAAAGHFQDAVTVLEAATRQAERACGRGDDVTLAAVEDHAAVCLAAGQPREAARLLKRVLTGRERTQGPDDPATLASGGRLAAAFLAAGQFRDATRLCEELLARSERARGPDDPGTLAAVARLAAACSTAGQVSAALRHYQRAADGYEQALGAGHPSTLACLGELARAYYDAGHLGDAVTVLRAAIISAGDALSPGDPVTGTLRALLAGITEDTAAR